MADVLPSKVHLIPSMELIRKYKITSVPYNSAPSRYNTYSDALQ